MSIAQCLSRARDSIVHIGVGEQTFTPATSQAAEELGFRFKNSMPSP
jgi:hypothetical protein